MKIWTLSHCLSTCKIQRSVTFSEVNILIQTPFQVHHRRGVGSEELFIARLLGKKRKLFYSLEKKRIQDTISCLNLLPAQLSVAHLKSTNITGSPDLFPRHPDLDQELDSVQDSPKTQFPPRSTLVLVCRWTCERSALSSLASSPSPSSTPSSSTMTWSPASAAFTGSSTAPGVHATCKWETQQSMRWASVGGAVRMSQPTQSSWPNGPTNAWGQKAGR